MATGGSTNAVLHLLATAYEFGVELAIDDFNRISRKTPVIADLRPWGTYTAPEMYEAGGMAVVPLGCGFVGVVSALCFSGLLVCLLSWICILPGRVLTYMVVE